MYLDADAVRRTFASLSALAAGSELVFDHIVSASDPDDACHGYVQAVAAAVGAQGESWRCTPATDEITEWLDAAGWSTVASIEESDSVPAGFWNRTDSLQPMTLVRFRHARLPAAAQTRATDS